MISDPHEDNESRNKFKEIVDGPISGVVAENERLKASLTASSGQIRDSLNAWMQLGAVGEIHSVFNALNQYAGRTTGRKSGLGARFRAFFIEHDDNTNALKSLKIRLNIAMEHLKAYHLRMNGLADDFNAAIGRYAAWTNELRHRAIGSADGELQRMFQHGAEYLDAQQQLSRLIMLQMRDLTTLQYDANQLAAMTDVLLKNQDAAQSLQQAREILSRYSNR